MRRAKSINRFALIMTATLSISKSLNCLCSHNDEREGSRKILHCFRPTISSLRTHGNESSFICFLSWKLSASINPHNNNSQPQVHYQLYEHIKRYFSRGTENFMHFSRAGKFSGWTQRMGEVLSIFSRIYTTLKMRQLHIFRVRKFKTQAFWWWRREGVIVNYVTKF